MINSLTAAEAIEVLIELVREREFIYWRNAKHGSHMDATMLANVWESIAKTVNVIGMDGEFICRIQVVNNQHRPLSAWCMSSACSFTFFNLDTGTNIAIAAKIVNWSSYCTVYIQLRCQTNLSGYPKHLTGAV